MVVNYTLVTCNICNFKTAQGSYHNILLWKAVAE